LAGMDPLDPAHQSELASLWRIPPLRVIGTS
jgi:hypothetical protein